MLNNKKFTKLDLEEVREFATRMWIDEQRPTEIDDRSANVFYIIKAFCYVYDIDMEFDVNRRNTEVIHDTN